MWIKRIICTVVAAVALASSACSAIPPPPVNILYGVQTPGTVHLQGDSVTFNTYWQTGLKPDYATTNSMVPGASVDVYGLGQTGKAADVLVPELVLDGKVDSIVWALGLNEITTEGFSFRQQLIWTDILGQIVPDESCKVLVLPWVIPPGDGYRPYTKINAVRNWMANFATKYPNVVLVDWKPILEAHPEFSPIDGTHIDNKDGAPFRDAMYRDGLSRCP